MKYMNEKKSDFFYLRLEIFLDYFIYPVLLTISNSWNINKIKIFQKKIKVKSQVKKEPAILKFCISISWNFEKDHVSK